MHSKMLVGHRLVVFFCSVPRLIENLPSSISTGNCWQKHDFDTNICVPCRTYQHLEASRCWLANCTLAHRDRSDFAICDCDAHRGPQKSLVISETRRGGGMGPNPSTSAPPVKVQRTCGVLRGKSLRFYTLLMVRFRLFVCFLYIKLLLKGVFPARDRLSVGPQPQGLRFIFSVFLSGDAISGALP